MSDRLEEHSVDFFERRIAVSCSTRDAEEMRFLFGPHVSSGTPGPRPMAHVTLSAQGGAFFASLLAKDQRTKSFEVVGADGGLVSRRTFSRWSGVPSPLPPFEALKEHVRVAQATVLARDGRTVALTGAPHAGKTRVGVELLSRGWSLVSDQLLVVGRSTGSVYPYLVPVGLRGATLAAFREQGGADYHAHRETRSEVTGPVLLLRPEALGRVVPVTGRYDAPTVYELLTAVSGETVNRSPGGAPPRFWPPEPPDEQCSQPVEDVVRVCLPAVSGAGARAADLIEEDDD